MDLALGERAVHRRGRLAFGAATAGGLPGRFEVFELGGLQALLTTSPELGFLNSVTGVNARSLAALPEVLAAFAAAGAPIPAVVGSSDNLASIEQRTECRAASGPVRPIAMLVLQSRGDWNIPSNDLQVRPAVGKGPGHLSRGALSRLRGPRRTRPVPRHRTLGPAGAALCGLAGRAPRGRSGDVTARRRCSPGRSDDRAGPPGYGVQAALLRGRLEAAAEAGARCAVATAAADAPSVRNLARSGFTVHLRHSWFLDPMDRLQT